MKRISLFSLLFVVAFAFEPVFSMGTPEAGEPLRVAALKGPTGIGMIRLFEAMPSGLQARITAVATPDLVIAQMTAGEVDIALLPVNVAAKLYTAGLGYRLAGIVGNGMVSFLTSDPSVTTIGDLAGKEIYVAGQGATPEFLVRYLLQNAGMDPDKDVRLVFSMPYPEIAASLAAGRIAYAVLPEPFTTLAKSKNPALLSPIDLSALYSAASGERDYPMSAVVVKASTLEARPDAVAVFMKAYKASIEWVRSNPVEAGKLVAKYDMGLSAEVAAIAIPRSNYVFVQAGEARAAVERLLSIFLSLNPKSIGGALPDSGFYAKTWL